MAAEWFYLKDDKQVGPVSGGQLKQLADSGRLQPVDLVWKQGMANRVAASKVQGLFSSASPSVPSPPVVVAPPPVVQVVEAAPTTTESTTEQAVSGWHSVPVVLVLTTFFFPVGLSLVWTHPRWVNRTKMIWTGCCALFLLVVFVTNSARKAEVAEKLASAHRQWGAGQKAEAVNVYRPLVEKELSLFDDADKPTVMQRIIEFDLASGAKDAARKTWERSKKENVAVTLTSAEGKQFLAELQAEEVAKAEQATAAAQASAKPVKLGEAGVAENLFSKNPKDDRIDFYDDTASFKGKLIQMKMNFGKPLPLGDAIQFYVYTYQPQAHFDLNIDIPDSVKVPKASHGDTFLVTFRCTKGDLEFGNVAVKIERQ
jgi:hypothetical protein